MFRVIFVTEDGLTDTINTGNEFEALAIFAARASKGDLFAVMLERVGVAWERRNMFGAYVAGWLAEA